MQTTFVRALQQTHWQPPSQEVTFDVIGRVDPQDRDEIDRILKSQPHAGE